MRWSEVMEEVRKSGGVIQPSQSDVHVNRPLTSISIAYMQMADAFVASRVFPNISVMKKSDSYWEYDRESWMRSQMKERAPGTEAEEASYMVSTSTYDCTVYALKDFIADQVRANTDTPLNLDRDSTDFLTGQSLLQKEKSFSSQFLADSVWTLSCDGAGSASATVDFSTDGGNNVIYWNAENSTPIEDVRTFKRAVQQRTGFRPNVGVFTRKIVDVLLEHPDIIGRLNMGQTSGPAKASMENLMSLFELEDILVMDGVEATNRLGATAAYNFINENDGLLIYRPARPGLRVPSAGYTFSWTGYVGAGPMGNRISRYRVDSRKADCIEIESAYDFKLVSADLGFFLDGIVQ